MRGKQILEQLIIFLVIFCLVWFTIIAIKAAHKQIDIGNVQSAVQQDRERNGIAEDEYVLTMLEQDCSGE